MKQIESYISPLIESQFPDFYKEEGPNFIAFVKAYYEWLESQDNVIYHSRKLSSYANIDDTLDSFIVYFKEKYLKNIQFTTDSNKQLFIKHALEFYKAKGSERAIDLFFRLIYGIPATIYSPGNDIFKLSDGYYTKPLYLEVSRGSKNISFVGKQITGSISGATAFVEKLVRKKINSQFIDVFFISNLRKDFQVNEILMIDDDLDNSPRVIGSLTSFEIIAGGSDFSIGDIVNIDSITTGAQAKARVTSSVDVTGLVDFTLSDGGWGFTTNSSVLVSERSLVVNNVIIANTSITSPFYLFDKITQPLANIAFNTLSGSFAVKDYVQKYNGGGTLVANAQIIALTQNTVTKVGEMFVSVISGNTELGTNFIYKTSNVANAAITTVTNKTVTANVIGISPDITIRCEDVHNTFQIGEEVYQYSSTETEWANGTVSAIFGTSANLFISVSSTNGVFRSSVNVYGRTSTAYANLKSFSTTIGVISINNAFTSLEGNYITASMSNTVANIDVISEGSLASFSIANIAYAQATVVNEDLLSANNTANIPFMSPTFIIDGSSGTGLAANGYGFFKNPVGNINSIILENLRVPTMASVGTITNITGINKGTNYTIDPFVLIIEPTVYALGAKDYVFTIDNNSGNFTEGELIQQSVTLSNVNVINVSSATTGNVEILHVSNVSGPFTTGEIIYQNDGTANIGYGVLQAASITSNAGTLTVKSVSNVFSNAPFKIKGAVSIANATIDSVSYNFFENYERVTQPLSGAIGYVQSSVIDPVTRIGQVTLTSVTSNFVTTPGYKIVGTLSVANAIVDTVTTTNPTINTQALITKVVNTSTLNAKRLSLSNYFYSGGIVTGVSTGSTARLVAFKYSNTFSGLNSIVLANTTIATGSITGLSLYDSGFGYSNGDVLEFYSQDGQRAGTAKLILQKQGTGEGYFKNQKGFLSENSHMFDGNFYQEYSYQVISRLPFETYSDMLKKVLHIAGTRVFGKVQLEEQVNASFSSIDLTLKHANVLFKNVSNTEIINPNMYVYNTDGTSTYANGYVDAYPSAEVVVKRWDELINSTYNNINLIGVTRRDTFNANTQVNGTLETIAITNANTYYSVNDRVTYHTLSTGGTSTVGLSNNSPYYISFTNSSAIALSSAIGSANINLTASTTIESGHVITKGNFSIKGITFSPDGLYFYTCGSFSYQIMQYVLSTPWDLSTATFYQQFETAPIINSVAEIELQSIRFSSDGLKMFLLGTTNDYVYQYNLTSPWKVSTASYANIAFYIGTHDGTATGLEFDSTGSKMFILGNDYDIITEFILFTAWDITTAEKTFNASLNVSSVNDTIAISNANKYYSINDRILYAVRPGNTAISPLVSNTYYYISFSNSSTIKLASTLGGANLNITSGLLESGHSIRKIQTFSVTSQDTNPVEIQFNRDGTVLYMVGSTNSRVFQYALSNAYTINTTSYTSNYFSLSTQLAKPSSLYINPIGTALFVAANTASSEDCANVFQYSIPTTYPSLGDNFEVGTIVAQPNLSINAASGYLAYKGSNATHTTLYLSNTRGTFTNTANIESISQRVITVAPMLDIAIKSVLNSNPNTRSYDIGSTVYQGASYGAATFTALVAGATANTVRVSSVTGTLVDNQTLYSANATALGTYTSSNAYFHTSTTFTTAQTVSQKLSYVNLININNANTTTKSFNVNEYVVQYITNPSVSDNVYNYRTASGLVTDANSSVVQIVNIHGTFANTREVYGLTSNAYATINGIKTVNTATGNVVYSLGTTLVVKDTIGTFVTNRQIIGANAISNATLVVSNAQLIQSSNLQTAINILTIANTKGTFSANSTANGVIVMYPDNVTIAATANLTSVKIESI